MSATIPLNPSGSTQAKADKLRFAPKAGRKLKVGIVADELFAPGITGIGGFGWLAKQMALVFNQADLGIEPVLIMARRVDASIALPEKLHGTRVLWTPPTWTTQIGQLRREHFDILITVCLQLVYRRILWALPRTTTVIWAIDPWPKADQDLLATLRLPGQSQPPQGLHSRDLTVVRYDAFVSRVLGRKLHIAGPSQLIIDRVTPTYAITPRDVTLIPYPMDPPKAGSPKAPEPTVLILGRLDPIKRPWIAAEIARQLPEVQFILAGKSHFGGAGSWSPVDLPPNLRHIPHIDGDEKVRHLSSAWLLLNCSIHEGLPISFVEALSFSTPIVSCVDPDGIVSEFGRFVGLSEGDGMELVPRFVAAIRELIANNGLRSELGNRGKQWVSENHTQENFLNQFELLCRKAKAL